MAKRRVAILSTPKNAYKYEPKSCTCSQRDNAIHFCLQIAIIAQLMIFKDVYTSVENKVNLSTIMMNLV